MARVTVEDCLEQEENRFALVILASARTRELMRGALPRVRSTNKPSVTSLREIAAGRVRFGRPSAEIIDEWVDEQHRENDRRLGCGRRSVLEPGAGARPVSRPGAALRGRQRG